jgi:hypothetical protein
MTLLRNNSRSLSATAGAAFAFGFFGWCFYGVAAKEQALR